MGDFPVNVAVHPDGIHAAVLHCGYSKHEIRLLDLRAGREVAQVPLGEAFYGLAWSADGARLYASGAGDEVVHEFQFRDGRLTDDRALRLPALAGSGVPGGLAVARDGRSLYVVETWGQRVTKLNLRSGEPEWVVALAAPGGPAETLHEGERLRATGGADAPFPYTCLTDERRGRLYVSLWAKAMVLVLDATTGREAARWSVGAHPNEMLLAADGRLFVAEANLNTVSVLDTADGRVQETLHAALFPGAPPGSTPNSLALAPDGTTLFVANANNNNIAVFDVSKPRQAASLGFIPVGWFPTSVRVTPDGRTLVVANGKGVGSAPNPAGPFPGDTRPRTVQEYIGALMRGTVSLVPLPAAAARAAQFGQWTKTAYANTPLAESLRPRTTRPAGNPIPGTVGDPSPIRYCLYVIKENRTYDQVFGDVPEGNGDPRLCLFGEAVTPNQHALAREFVLLDNFYADGEVSADGHEWTMGAYASDFVEKAWPLSYGHNARKKYDYPAEGRYPVAFPVNGYLWDRAAAAGVSYRSYGEFCQSARDGSGRAEPSLPVLVGHIDPEYRAWDLEYPDVKRAERFIAELRRFEAAGDMPRLQVLRLGNDHTSGTRAGSRTPAAMVADNDLALGRIVEAVSRSKFWPQTAIFVLEDDAQNGPDHVDAHRMPGLVISPYVRRRAVDSTLYSTTSMLRTIELILGLQPMSQFDAAAAPMYASFQPEADLAPYAARPARVDLEARNTRTAWGAERSRRMDFSAPDRADDLELNEIVWRAVRGADAPMPAPVRAAFFKAHPVRELDPDD
jgi:DNA-binding beta-propeller fold protein YncE